MTLNKTWKECLRMWKWIAKQIDKREGVDIIVLELKEEWLVNHGYGVGEIKTNCFFCQYAVQAGSHDCSLCPGVLVNKRFDCSSRTYSYGLKPKKFYKKLLQLDAKRRKK